MILNCMIVDDDLMSRKALERHCAKMESLNLVYSCESAEEALERLPEDTIELIFLDIEMPGLSGIDFLEKVPIVPQVIFTTSKPEYAFEAFEYQVTDFLKKPIAYPRFLKAVEKVLDVQQQNNAYKASSQEIYVKSDGKYIRLPFDHILYFENVGDYVSIKTTNGNYIINSTLKNIDLKLSNPQFLKVHRSYIVNLKKIKNIEENTLVIERKVIPISRANKPVLMSKLNLLN
ncbi:MAG: LytTR family DNA-binding domain-containing protein [Bacteroidota bacterium]